MNSGNKLLLSVLYGQDPQVEESRIVKKRQPGHHLHKGSLKTNKQVSQI